MSNLPERLPESNGSVTPSGPYDWGKFRSQVSDYGGIIGLVLLVFNALAWMVGLMPPSLSLVLGGAFGMLALLGFWGWFRVSRDEQFNSIGKWIGREKEEVKHINALASGITENAEGEHDKKLLDADIIALKSQIAELTNESRQLKPQYQRDLIGKWRRMVVVAHRKYKSSKERTTFTDILERQPDYVSLSPHLSVETLDLLNYDKFRTVTITVKEGGSQRGRVIVSDDDIVAELAKDITRIEKEWGLI